MQKKKTILFLCTGNTCRSPMAAGYLQKLLKEKGVKDIEVKCAGVMTIPGLLATPEAIQIMDSVGVDLRRHRSTQLSKDHIRKADLILGMTPFHVQSALRVSEEARGKTFLFKEYTRSDLKNTQIVDPMGCTLEVYKKVFNEIKQATHRLLKMDIIGLKPSKEEKKPARKVHKAKTRPKEAKARKRLTKKQTVPKRAGKKWTRPKRKSQKGRS
jgi:protein-tyrosine-phosphatase